MYEDIDYPRVYILILIKEFYLQQADEKIKRSPPAGSPLSLSRSLSLSFPLPGFLALSLSLSLSLSRSGLFARSLALSQRERERERERERGERGEIATCTTSGSTVFRAMFRAKSVSRFRCMYFAHGKGSNGVWRVPLARISRDLLHS